MLKEVHYTISQLILLGLGGLACATLLTPIYTNLAFKHQWWKLQRSDSITGEKAKVFHKLHAKKHNRNIPTMAGIISVISLIIVTVLFNLDRNQTWLPLVATIAAGLVGLFDDYINLRSLGKGSAGMASWLKFSLVASIGVIGGLYSYFKLGYDTVAIPFQHTNVTLGIGFVVLFAFIIVATANAVNITDGLDGLAGGLLISAFSAYTVIAALQNNFGIAGFCITLVGILVSYTWFNIFPARFFMGDVGSFMFGTALGVVAMLTDTMLVLPVIGLVFVFETSSSGLQILSKKFRNGKKIFKSAPIHHHFEASGWPEPKVTMRFWLIGQMCAGLGLLLAITGGMV